MAELHAIGKEQSVDLSEHLDVVSVDSESMTLFVRDIQLPGGSRTTSIQTSWSYYFSCIYDGGNTRESYFLAADYLSPLIRFKRNVGLGDRKRKAANLDGTSVALDSRNLGIHHHAATHCAILTVSRAAVPGTNPADCVLRESLPVFRSEMHGTVL